MDSEQVHKLTMKILNAPLVDWDHMITRLPVCDRRVVEDQANAIASKSAMLSGYLEGRGTVGLGDAGHAEAVKRANSMRKKVRRALGFNATRNISF